MAEFPASEFRLDGEPAAIRVSAGRWTSFGTAATEAAAQIRSLDSSLFVGPEGDQYRAGLNQDLPPHLDTTGRAYTAVGTTLTTYASTLTGLQDRMAPLRTNAPGLWEALQQAQHRVTAAHSADQRHQLQIHADAKDATQTPDAYQSDLGPATTSLSAAEKAWNDCLSAARAVTANLRAVVDRTDRAIRDAADLRFAHNPHGVHALASGFKNFVTDHAKGLSQLSGALKIVSGIAAVLSFIPVIGEVALAVSLVTAGTALLIDASIKYATGKGSWTSIAIDGTLLALPFGIGKGITALRGARGAEKLATGATETGSRASTGAAKAEQDLPGVTTERVQLEKKFKHATYFGVTESRSNAGFTAYGKAVDAFVSSPSTVRISGTYRGNPVILNYDSTSRLVVVQSPDGAFVSGWRMTEPQLRNVITRGSLGGG